MSLRWLLWLPVCALLLWAVLPLGRDAGQRGVTNGPPPAPRPEQRALAPEAVARVVPPVAEPVRAPGDAGPPLPQLAASDSVRKALQIGFEKQRQMLELRNVQRFARAETAFAATPRGDAGQRVAEAERAQKLRAAVLADGAGARLRTVECRDPLCKLEIAAPEPMEQPLGQGLHFVREAGVQTASAFRERGAARVLTIYVVRDGASFESLLAQRAE